MSLVYLNGDFVAAEEARISPLDRGFLFADGIYEVIPAYNSTLFRFDAHMARLDRSLAAINLANPFDHQGWRELCQSLIDQNGGGNVSVYLQVTRGTSMKRDHAFPNPPVNPTIFMMTSPIAVPEADSPDNAVGAAAITLDDIRWARCDIKSVSLLPNSLLRQQAVANGAAEAILLKDGFVTEGAASNVFVVMAGRIVTPPKNHAILGGVTRDVVVDLCREHDIPLDETEISEFDLTQAEEIWVTSSTKEIVPIVSLNNRPVANGQPGPLWRLVAGHYVQRKRQLCGH